MKKTVNILVPAYNAQENINSLVESLLHQKNDKNFVFTVTVYSDTSTDNTNLILSQIGSINFIEGKKRLGFAGVLKKFIKNNHSDYLIILNDDIAIASEYFVDNLLKGFTDNKVGLVSGNPIPKKPKNFVQRGINATYESYKKIKYGIDNGNNKFTCDGKVLCLSRDFCRSIKFPQDISLLGNVDIFLYFTCKKNGYKYVHQRDAIALFEFPSTLKDYLKWDMRNNANFFMMKEYFGKMVEESYLIPRSLWVRSVIPEIVKNPLESMVIYLVGILAKSGAKKYAKKFTPFWETITSTKVKVSY